MRRYALIVVLMALVSQAAPARAAGLGPFAPPAPPRPNAVEPDPVGAICAGTDPDHRSPLCAPFRWIEILIVPGPTPQFTFRPYLAHTVESRGIPLGYLSNPVQPLATGTVPRTYWVKAITNLTDEPMTVTRCDHSPWEGEFGNPRCGVTLGLFDPPPMRHKVGPGARKVFDDPASYENKRVENGTRGGNYFFPVDDDNFYAVWNQAHYITTLERREMRGLLKHVYFDCSGPEQPHICQGRG